jgi:ABC-2 type transport system ATP-binding protein
VDLSDKSQARIRTLSGGQRRRLDVALGIIGNPDLLSLDEPTTGFDPKARRAFWGLIRKLRDEGSTILLTTHYLDETEELAVRVAVIKDGKIIEMASPKTLASNRCTKNLCLVLTVFFDYYRMASIQNPPCYTETKL